MSYTMVKAIWPGEKVEDYMKLQNSWGSAVVIWSIMTREYVSDKPTEWLNHLDDLAKLAYNTDIPLHHRAVLIMTFDRAYVLKRDYEQASKDIEQFFDDFSYPVNFVNHWDTIAKIFTNAYVPAIGFQMTSTSVDPFSGPYDEETETYLPFDWSTAVNVYDELNSVN
jgi:hypothetical protein